MDELDIGIQEEALEILRRWAKTCEDKSFSCAGLLVAAAAQYACAIQWCKDEVRNEHDDDAIKETIAHLKKTGFLIGGIVLEEAEKLATQGDN